MPYFVVVNEQGPAWAPARAMRDQARWNEHAAYVNEALAAGRVILGGPLGSGRPIHRAMLIVHAESETAVRDWIAVDPWIRDGTLRTASVESWDLIATHDRLDRVLAEIPQPRAR